MTLTSTFFHNNIFGRVDISIFGDALEIPEEVPTIVREVTPTLPLAGGVAAATASSLGEDHEDTVDKNGHNGMSRNYDHLFDDIFDEVVEDLPIKDGEDYTNADVDAAFTDTGIGEDRAKQESIDGTRNVMDASNQPLPVIVTAQRNVVRKKTRFKVKPSKSATKSGLTNN